MLDMTQLTAPDWKVFRDEIDELMSRTLCEPDLLISITSLMRKLIRTDAWLPQWAAEPHAQYYRQYLLHVDPRELYSVVSFVWGPGQRTPIHDHGVWGVIGMLRGSEVSQSYIRTPSGLIASATEELLSVGDVATVSPEIGDIHLVRNAHHDRISISIHVYGADIGKQSRHVFDPRTGAQKTFVSGYSNRPQPAN